MASKLLAAVFRSPGIGGLNFEGEQVGRDPSSARVAENIVFDEAGRMCSRKGFTILTGGGNEIATSPAIEALHMMDTSSGNKLIVSANGAVYESSAPYSSFTDVTGTITPPTNDIQFVNFGDELIGSVMSEPMFSKTYAGNCTPITAASGTTPSGNCVHSAFGRLWAQKSDTGTGKAIIAYSALLDKTHWTTGAGEINILGTAGAVRFGYDELVAISSFDNFLIAFLRDSIIIYNNPDVPGSLGIEKVIQGVGCIARDSVQQTGDDIVFLSATGLRSFRHTVQSENNVEIGDISSTVRKTLITKVNQTTASTIKSAFFPEDALFLLLTGDTIWAVDLHETTTTQEGPARITTFPNTTWESMVYHEGVLYLGEAGVVGTYSGYLDKTETYNMVWYSAWADFDSTKIKHLKKINAVVVAAAAQTITFNWYTDYGDSFGTATKSIPSGGDTAEWGTSEWGEAEWAGGSYLAKILSNASRSGEVISFGFNITINNAKVCLEQVAVYMTLGREAR